MISRGKFISIAVGTTIATGAIPYLLSDKTNLLRADLNRMDNNNEMLKPDEKEILFLASLAPSGHNTQPWFIHYLEPYHWIIGNDNRKWLPAVDPTQRETILLIGAFIQNLDYAAGAFGYVCDWSLLATTNQDERVMEVKLNKTGSKNSFDISKIKNRRTVRSNFLSDELKKEDIQNLVNSDSEFVHYLPSTSKESQFISSQTIVANRLQIDRDPAQQELAEWIRFSSKDAEKYRDGLTTASMEDFPEESFVKFVFGKKIDKKVWLIFGSFSLWRLFMIWIAFGINKPISILSIIINLPLLILLGGLKELGWRGILQPKLEKVVNYLPSVLIAGIIWSTWHLPLWFIKGTVQSSFPFGLYLFSGIILTSSFTTLYKYTNNLFLCVLSHAWFNGCIGLALYIGNNGTLQLNLNWKVVVVFSLELIISIILGIIYSRKKSLLYC